MSRKFLTVSVVVLAMMLVARPGPAEEVVTLHFYNVAGHEGFYVVDVMPAFMEAHPEIEVVHVRTTWSEMLSKLKVLEEAGKLEPGMNDEIHVMVIGAGDAFHFIDAGFTIPILPDHEDALPNVEGLIGIGHQYIEAWGGHGVTVHIDYYPLLLRNPDVVPEPITDVEQLKAWIMANPGRFMYGRPANSGPGRTFVWGLAAALGEDPNRPEEWVKTWEYLRAIHPYIDAYPPGTGPTIHAFAMGAVDIIPLGLGWQASLKHWWAIPPLTAVDLAWSPVVFADVHGLFIAPGVPQEVKEAALKFINFMLADETQALMGPTHYPATLGGWEAMDENYHRVLTGLMGRSFPDFLEEVEFVMLPPTEAMILSYDLWDEKIGALE